MGEHYLSYFNLVLLFLEREKERTRESESWGGGRARERERAPEADSILSTEPQAGFSPTAGRL